MKRRHTKPADIRRFIDYALSFESDTCLPWPFGRNSAGYGHFTEGSRWVLAHRVVCERANGPATDATLFAAHECGNGHAGCVNPKHIRWKTPKENSADMVRHGRSQRGEQSYNSRLTEHDVRFIRANKDAMSAPEMAKKLGVHRGVIHHVLRGNSWAWVTDTTDAA